MILKIGWLISFSHSTALALGLNHYDLITYKIKFDVHLFQMIVVISEPNKKKK